MLRTRPCTVGQAYVAFDRMGQHSFLIPDRALWGGRITSPSSLEPAFVSANPTVQCAAGVRRLRPLGPAFVAANPTVQCGAGVRRLRPLGPAFVAANPTVQCGAVTRIAGQANSVQELKATIIHVTLPSVVPPSVSASTSPARPPAAPCRLPSSLILHTFGEVFAAAFHNPTPRFPRCPNPAKIMSNSTLHSVLLPLYSEGPMVRASSSSLLVSPARRRGRLRRIRASAFAP